MGIQTISPNDLCIGPDRFGSAEQQSLLMIDLIIIVDDFWEESEPANWEPHFLDFIARWAEFLQRSTSLMTKEREGKLLAP